MGAILAIAALLGPEGGSRLRRPRWAGLSWPPAEHEIQHYFGVTPPSVHQMVLTLERARLIRRQPGVPRSIEVLVPPEQLPILETSVQPIKSSATRY